jgi:hypothetical protein
LHSSSPLPGLHHTPFINRTKQVQGLISQNVQLIQRIWSKREGMLSCWDPRKKWLPESCFQIFAMPWLLSGAESESSTVSWRWVERWRLIDCQGV